MGRLNLKVFIGKSKRCAFLGDCFSLSCMRDLVLAEPKERMCPALGLSDTMLSWVHTRCATGGLQSQHSHHWTQWLENPSRKLGQRVAQSRSGWGRSTVAFGRSLFEARVWMRQMESKSFLFWKAVLWWEYSSLQRAQSILPARRTQQLSASIEQASPWHLRALLASAHEHPSEMWVLQ